MAMPPRVANQHAEETLFRFAQSLVRQGQSITDIIRAIGISHTEGPCPERCQPIFSAVEAAGVIVYWLGHV